MLAATLGVDIGPGRLRALAAQARAALAGTGRRAPGAPTTRPRVGPSTASWRRSPTASRSCCRDATTVASRPASVPSSASSPRSRSSASSGWRASCAGGSEATGATEEAAQRCLRSLLAVDRCREELASCQAAGSDEVVWATGGERPSIRSAPLDVSRILAAQVFSQMPGRADQRDDAARAGQPARRRPQEATDVLDVGSPFPYKEHGLVYCAVDLPDRRTPGGGGRPPRRDRGARRGRGRPNARAVHEPPAMLAAAEAVGPRLEWPVLTQGELPKAALLEALAAEQAACLFATMGFWQGVDVAGPALTLVILDKLPFPRPDDPLMAARREAAGRDGFRVVDLPRAATLLAQGAGRLIRSGDGQGGGRRARPPPRQGLLRPGARGGAPARCAGRRSARRPRRSCAACTRRRSPPPPRRSPAAEPDHHDGTEPFDDGPLRLARRARPGRRRGDAALARPAHRCRHGWDTMAPCEANLPAPARRPTCSASTSTTSARPCSRRPTA